MISLRSCCHFFFLSSSRASTIGCVLLSFAKTLRLALVRGCALSFASRFLSGLAFAFSLAFFRLLNSFAFPLGCSRGCHVFEIVDMGTPATAFRDVFVSQNHILRFHLFLHRGMLLSTSFSHKMGRTVQATVQAEISKLPLLFLLHLSVFCAFLSRCPRFLSRPVRKLSCAIQQKTGRSSGLKLGFCLSQGFVSSLLFGCPCRSHDFGVYRCSLPW